MITSKQISVLSFVERYIAERGIAPAYDEIQQALDLSSKSAVARSLTVLENRGFIRRLKNRARAIEILRSASRIMEEQTNREISVEAAARSQFQGQVNHLGLIGGDWWHQPVLPSPVGMITLPHILPNQFAMEVSDAEFECSGILRGDLVVLRPASTIEFEKHCLLVVDGQRFGLRICWPQADLLVVASHRNSERCLLRAPSDVSCLAVVTDVMRRY